MHLTSLQSRLSSYKCSLHRSNVPVPGCRAAAVLPYRAVHVSQSSQRRHRRQPVVKAAEDTQTASQTEADASAAPEHPNGASQSMSALDRAREELQADSPDKGVIEQAFAELEAELMDLRAKLETSDATASTVSSLEAAVSSQKEQYLRLNADFDNFRRRTAGEKEELSSRAKGDVVATLLPLVDNFELARTQVKAESEAEQKINNSYQGLYKQMVDILKGLGVDAVPTVGSPFDPALHDAIMREPNDEVADGTVLQEFRKGFRMGERLLRPAMVKVSFTDSPSMAQSADTDSEPDTPAASE
eukprot:jgi/Chrzof1/4845/Cz15g01110.t1